MLARQSGHGHTVRVVDDEGSMIRRRRIGILLRQYREAAGLTIAQVAEELDCSGPKVSRVETAKVPAQRRDVRDMLNFYGVTDDQRQEIMDLLRDAKTPGWWDQYTDQLPKKYSTFIGFEADAAVCRTYEPLVIPGLLQTEEYARATIRKTLPDATPEDIDARVEVRMRRQGVLTKAQPMRLRTVVTELALRQQVGPRATMHAQYQRLIELAQLPNVSLQVHSFNGALACTTGPFIMIEFRDRADKGAIYVENAAGDLYLEKPHQLERYTLVFEELCADALGADDSLELVRQIDHER
jgi:transcriptional regulator with XRE-family HTH domain